MSGLMSFLTGSAFRMVWGEVASYMTKRQEHNQEIELIRIQSLVAGEVHARNLEALRLQNDLGVKTIAVQAEAATNAGELDAWIQAVKSTNEPTGIGWIDSWNKAIRPAIATMAIICLVIEIFLLGHLTDFHREIFGAALGLFIADRSLKHRGK